VTDHQGDTIGNQFTGNGLRLARIAGIIANDQGQLLPEHTTHAVDIGDGLLGAALKLLPRPGARTCHRSGKTDTDFRPQWRR
jgi:hypothetical protein